MSQSSIPWTARMAAGAAGGDHSSSLVVPVDGDGAASGSSTATAA
ncbi:hypothetical protein [Geodermatophilus sp. URMC 64]